MGENQWIVESGVLKKSKFGLPNYWFLSKYSTDFKILHLEFKLPQRSNVGFI